MNAWLRTSASARKCRYKVTALLLWQALIWARPAEEQADAQRCQGRGCQVSTVWQAQPTWVGTQNTGATGSQGVVDGRAQVRVNPIESIGVHTGGVYWCATTVFITLGAWAGA